MSKNTKTFRNALTGRFTALHVGTGSVPKASTIHRDLNKRIDELTKIVRENQRIVEEYEAKN